MPEAAPRLLSVPAPPARRDRPRRRPHLLLVTDGGFRPDGTFVSWPVHDTAVWVPEDDRAFATRLARYCARNPVALERLTYDRTAKHVTTRYYGWYANRPRGMRGKAPAEATRRWAKALRRPSCSSSSRSTRSCARPAMAPFGSSRSLLASSPHWNRRSHGPRGARSSQPARRRPSSGGDRAVYSTDPDRNSYPA